MAKTIFNTSEKSNFILNMTEEKYSGIASKALMITCILISLFTIPAECIKDVGFSIISAGLAVAGVICLILALIAVVKKFVDKKMLFPIGAFGVMLIWGVISLLNSYDTNVSFYGFNGRGEGLLALIFYFGFFITGMTIKKDKALTTLLNSIIAVGVLNAVWGVLQIFIPAMPSSYSYVITAGRINAASGLAQSPIFLAMLLSLSLTAALISFIMSENKKRRIVCIICACLFSFVMMFTYSLVGMFGIAFAVIAAIAVVVISKAPKMRLVGILGVILPATASIVLIATGCVGEHNSYNLYDGPLMWSDSYSRLSSSGVFNPKAIDIKDTEEVYSYINEKTCNIIKKYPMTGTGPENLVYAQLYSSETIDKNIGTFDKCYNEYLYTAATRGVPSLIALVAVLASMLFIAGKMLKKNKKSITAVSFFFLLLCGVVLFFVGCSNIVFSSIFWAAAGASYAAVSLPVSKHKDSKK